MEISFILDDYIYNNKYMSEEEADKYFIELDSYKLNVNTNQVLGKLHCMKDFIVKKQLETQENAQKTPDADMEIQENIANLEKVSSFDEVNNNTMSQLECDDINMLSKENIDSEKPTLTEDIYSQSILDDFENYTKTDEISKTVNFPMPTEEYGSLIQSSTKVSNTTLNTQCYKDVTRDTENTVSYDYNLGMLINNDISYKNSDTGIQEDDNIFKANILNYTNNFSQISAHNRNNNIVDNDMLICTEQIKNISINDKKDKIDMLDSKPKRKQYTRKNNCEKGSKIYLYDKNISVNLKSKRGRKRKQPLNETSVKSVKTNIDRKIDQVIDLTEEYDTLSPENNTAFKKPKKSKNEKKKTAKSDDKKITKKEKPELQKKVKTTKLNNQMDDNCKSSFNAINTSNVVTMNDQITAVPNGKDLFFLEEIKFVRLIEDDEYVNMTQTLTESFWNDSSFPTIGVSDFD